MACYVSYCFENMYKYKTLIITVDYKYCKYKVIPFVSNKILGQKKYEKYAFQKINNYLKIQTKKSQ